MGKLRNALRWPAKKGNGKNPWYFIAWKVLMFALVIPVLVVGTIAYGLFDMSLHSAADFWKRNT